MRRRARTRGPERLARALIVVLATVGFGGAFGQAWSGEPVRDDACDVAWNRVVADMRGERALLGAMAFQSLTPGFSAMVSPVIAEKYSAVDHDVVAERRSFIALFLKESFTYYFNWNVSALEPRSELKQAVERAVLPELRHRIAGLPPSTQNELSCLTGERIDQTCKARAVDLGFLFDFDHFIDDNARLRRAGVRPLCFR